MSKGIKVPGLQADKEGWFRVSYHVAGVDSAWVQQSKMRQAYPMLDTKVVNVSHKPCEWNAEIHVKLKESQDV